MADHDKAWRLIIEQFFSMCKETSSEKGVGIHIFKMLSKNKSTSTKNCSYCFLQKESILWDRFTSGANDLVKKLTEDTIMISVHIPATDDENDTVGSIKLFDKDGEEIK